MAHVTHVGATCRPTQETVCCQGQGERFAQGGPRRDSLSEHGRSWYLQLGDLGSARVVPTAFLFCSGTQAERGLRPCSPFAFYTPARSCRFNTPGPAVPLGLCPAFSHCRQLPAQARGCLPGEKPPGLLRQRRWPHSNAIVALWPPTKSKFLKSRR